MDFVRVATALSDFLRKERFPFDRAQVALAFEKAGLRRKYDELLESL